MTFCKTIHATNVYRKEKSRSSKTSTDWSENMTQLVYEEPDKLASSGQGNYELTECPAYESTTSKPHPQPTETENSYYEM